MCKSLSSTRQLGKRMILTLASQFDKICSQGKVSRLRSAAAGQLVVLLQGCAPLIPHQNIQ